MSVSNVDFSSAFTAIALSPAFDFATVGINVDPDPDGTAIEWGGYRVSCDEFGVSAHLNNVECTPEQALIAFLKEVHQKGAQVWLPGPIQWFTGWRESLGTTVLTGALVSWKSYNEYGDAHDKWVEIDFVANTVLGEQQTSKKVEPTQMQRCLTALCVLPESWEVLPQDITREYPSGRIVKSYGSVLQRAIKAIAKDIVDRRWDDTCDIECGFDSMTEVDGNNVIAIRYNRDGTLQLGVIVQLGHFGSIELNYGPANK